MAQKIATSLIDDLDGGKADETIRFVLDGADYEIDLSAPNAARFRETLAPYITAGRRTSTKRRSRKASQPAAGTRDLAEVRAWARGNGWPDIRDRGRISAEILEAYDRAT
ncbi:Lsr2 family protein [Frankia sp. AgB32]|uniref:histone-like nucleoid-structuring protein Lsr2 n=1 Tax=Frankia sp. AgB32 TaxID=631119 RepID=UPI002010A1B6|nr:Lsr2 family protein [Frankia sp. AgB32]MCK9894701.1 Lsr2 family protein [Frankia sp. AgB32]